MNDDVARSTFLPRALPPRDFACRCLDITAWPVEAVRMCAP